MSEAKKNIISYFDNMTLVVVAILFAVFPLLFLSSTTDAFVLPKQLFLIGLTSLALIMFALRTIAEGKLKIRTSPFDLPVALFAVVASLSAAFSVNRYDAFIAFTPLLFVILLYFVIVNTAKTERQLLILLGALTLGAVVSSLLTIFSFFNVYLLPFEYARNQAFTTFGSLLDQALYLAIVLPIAGYFGYNYLTAMNGEKKSVNALSTAVEPSHSQKPKGYLTAFAGSFIIIAIALSLTVYMLFTSQKPLILPFDTGLQTAMSAISQGSTNIFKSLLLGSGFGTYINDFTQFKPAAYNANPTLWAFTFFRSSSFSLELLATTGLLGLGAFAYLIFTIVKQKNFFLPLILAVIAAIVFPFSFTLVALFFMLLALFAVVCIHNNPNKFGEAEMYLVAFKKFLFAVKPEGERVEQSPSERKFSKILPIVFVIATVALLAFPLYLVTRFALSDLIFQRSLVAAAQNDGIRTYELQAESINTFPYRDIYYRSFSQTNLAIANALAVNQQGASPSAETQKNILTLIQQSINAGRNAVTISPMTSFNWNNLSSIYRSLIGFGQNADQFTVLTLNQAIALDTNNPQQYIDLGGVYYQLGQYDEAIRQFQIAINLKQDYANAYYNLGHALEEKGEYAQALSAYNAVKQLVSDNKENVAKIDADIANLAKREQGQGESTQTQPTASQSARPTVTPQAQQDPIDVNRPQTTLPERNPQETIPGPTISAPIPSPSTATQEPSN
ncbi:MAG: tetratricopeptide repeat protein [Candidatus Levybacteria bacterium]|nr:tetratricopeptide repeat protein [Candidatus Levybacteria bacterium]